MCVGMSPLQACIVLCVLPFGACLRANASHAGGSIAASPFMMVSGASSVDELCLVAGAAPLRVVMSDGAHQM